MRKLCLLIAILFAIAGHAASLNKIKIYYPIVSNKIPDQFVSSDVLKLDGFLGYRVNVNLEKRLLQIDSTTILSGFRHRPGSQTWLGEHVGKFLFSASNTYKYTGDDRLKKLTDAIVKQYIACQLPDGYLGTYLPKDYWTEWDVWTHKYAIIGLLSYYSVTGNQPALETAKRVGDLMCRTFGDEPGKRDLMVAGWHVGLAPGSILEPMVDLYRYTNDQKYLKFCEYIFRAWEQPNGPKIISGLEKYGQVTKVGNAKAYEMLSCFVGILKYYKVTGDARLLKDLEIAWADICKNRLYITGTASQDEHFGADGVLPAENDTHMGEGCVTTTWIQFNLHLLQITGDPKYSQEIERSVYNHLFAAENPQTGCVSYYTALQGAKPYKCDQGYSCCLSSVPRGMSLITSEVWGKINGVFSILMIEPGIVMDSIIGNDKSKIGIKVEAKTSFPLEGKVSYTITPSVAKTFALNFRIPDWAKNYTATIGKKSYQASSEKLLKIERNWKAGDVVNISFEMPVEALSGGISYPGKVALKRGPQVLAVDQELNGKVSSLSTLTCPSKNVSLNDVSKTLRNDWSWKQAYSVQMKDGDKEVSIVLVPFSEAGQYQSEIITWISSK